MTTISSDFILSKKSGTLYVNNRAIGSMIEEDGITVSPGGMNSILSVSVVFFARSYAEVEDMEAILEKQNRRVKEVFDEGAKNVRLMNFAGWLARSGLLTDEIQPEELIKRWTEAAK